MYPFNHSHRSFGWSLSLCSLLHIVGSFAKFQTGNGNEIVIVRILIDDKQPRGRESNRIESYRIESDRIGSNRIESDRIRKGTKNFSPERNELRERNETSYLLFLFLFFVVAHPSIIKYRSSRFAIRAAREISSSLRPRNEKLALAWDISSKCKLPTVKRTMGYESVSGARGREEKTWMWRKEGRSYRCSATRNIRVGRCTRVFFLERRKNRAA